MEELVRELQRSEASLELLRRSYYNDLAQRRVSEKTKALTFETLVIIASVFDNCMQLFFQKEIAPFLNEKKDDLPVYFPVASNKEELNKKLEKMKIDANHYQELFAVLDSVQPYALGFSWIQLFFSVSRGKDINLAPVKSLEKRTLIIDKRCASLFIENGKARVSITGILNEGEAGFDVLQEVWKGLVFNESDIEVLLLCGKAIEAGYTLVDKFARLGVD